MAVGSTVTSARVTGALLVERGLVTPAQLAEALEHQRANGGELEDVLQYLFTIHPDQVAEVVAAYRRHEISVDVGSLLIAAGAVDVEKLDEARRRSTETGQPLGPILVEMGAISRLELASALADQWSDSPAQILPPPGVAERVETGATAEDVEDLRFAMRALEDSVRAERIADAGDDALEQIQRREDALAARVAALEIAIDQPIEVDPDLVQEIHATTQRLATLQGALEHVARAEDVAALAGALGDLEALRLAVEALDARTAHLPEPDVLARALADVGALTSRVDEAAASGAELATRAELDALRGAVEALGARPPGDPELVDRVAELSRSVEALAVLAEASSGPDGLQEALAGLGERIEAATDVAARAHDDLSALAATVVELGSAPQRIEELSDAGARVEQQVAELRDSVEAVVSATTELDALGATAAQTADDLAALRAVVDGLATLPTRVDELSARSSRTDELAESLRAVRDELAEVASRPAGEPGLAERLDELGASVVALARSVESVETIAQTVADVAGRVASVEGLAVDLATLRAALAELAERPDASDELLVRVTGLADRVEALSADALGPAAEAAVAGVAARVEQLAERQADGAGQVEQLRARVDDLRAEVAALRERRDGDPTVAAGAGALEAALAELRIRLEGTAPASTVASLLVAVEELQVAVAPLHALEARVGAVESRLGEAEARAEAAARATEGAIGAVREQLDAVSERTTAQLGTVLDRLDRMESAIASQDAPDDDLRADVAALGGAVESVRSTLEAELQRLEQAWDAERHALAAQAAAVAGGATPVADAGGAAPSSAQGPSAPELAQLARDLERLSDRVMEQERSLVEHFARRERALVERLGAGTDVGQRLAELTRRIEELRARVDRGAGGGGGVSEEEVAALKESFVSRLERLASSIDWRFQRLEGGPAAAAGRTDLHTRVDQLASMVEQLTGRSSTASSASEPATGAFLALVPSAGGHQLVELVGAVPAAGDRIDAPQAPGELLVVAVGSSPLPGDERPCVFVELVHEPDAAGAVAVDAGSSD
jgi:DNA repair exonuclease SbcCD ATPase subunit